MRLLRSVHAIYRTPYVVLNSTSNTHTHIPSIVGEQLNQEAKKMEVRDAALEDPYELPWNRGLKKYWVTINTWSIDGLPGLKRNLDKITPQGMRDAMHHAGLKNLEPPTGVFEKATAKGTKVQEIYMLVVGLVLGALFMNVVHNRLGGSQSSLRI